MIRQGTVTRVNQQTLCVLLDPAAQCSGCSNSAGCGAGLFNSLFTSRSSHIELPRMPGCQAGDRLALTFHSSVVLKMAFIAYCVPVLAMMLFAMICQYFVSSMAGHVALSGSLGLVAGLVGGLIAYPRISGYINNGSVRAMQIARIEPESPEFAVY